MPSLISFKKYNIFEEINFKFGHLKRTFQRYEEVKDKLDFYEVWYYSNSKKIKGFAVATKAVAEKNFRPQAVIYNRGGTKDFGQLNALYLLNHMGNWALNGYFVIGSQYSGNDGSEGKDEVGGADLDDVLNLKTVLEELNLTDNSQIIMTGASRGGTMCYLASTQVDWVNKYIIECGSVDEKDGLDRRQDLKEYRADCFDLSSAEELKKRSIIYRVGEIKPNSKFLIFHGSGDKAVFPERVLDFVSLLGKTSIDFEFHYLKDDHNFSQNRHFVDQKSLQWAREV